MGSASALGKDLTSYLSNIFSSQALFCMPLLSKSYLLSTWAKFEIHSALSASNRTIEYILPVVIDDTDIMVISRNIGYLKYEDHKSTGVAKMLKLKLEALRPGQFHPDPPAPVQEVGEPAFATGFNRIPFSAITKITEQEIVDLSEHTYLDSPPLVRALVAERLVRFLGFKYAIYSGPAYTAWRKNNKLFLSTLPQVGTKSSLGQKTLEFEIQDAPQKTLYLLAEWVPDPPDWGPIMSEDFHQLFTGLMANRSGFDMQRESTLHYLKEQKVNFRFPIVPFGKEAEVFCEWRREEPPSLFFDWDRNPRLTGPGIGVWTDVYHAGTGMLIFVLHGSWKNAALYQLEDCLELYLPGQYTRMPVTNGSMRFCIYLSNEGLVAKQAAHSDWDDLYRRVSLLFLALSRMTAAQDDIRVPVLSWPKDPRGQYFEQKPV